MRYIFFGVPELLIGKRPKYGEAVIVVEKHEPEGVFNTVWYSVDAECHGCWDNCGEAHPIDKIEELDKKVEEVKKRIMGCEEWKKKPKIKLYDFRKKQLTLNNYLE